MDVLSEGKLHNFQCRASFFLSLLCLTSAVSFWSFSGNTAAYIAILSAVPAFAVGWRRSFWGILWGSPALWASWCGFLLLAAVFLLQPGLPSIAAIGDFLPFALVPVLALAIAPLSRRGFTLRHLALLCLVASALAALVGVVGLAQGQVRATAPEFSPIHFATWAVTFGFMSLALTLSGRSPWRWLALAGPALGMSAAVASGTRAALVVGCALALLYGCVWVQKRSMPLWGKVAFPFALVGAVLLAVYLASLLGLTRPWDALRAAAGAITGDLGQDTSTAYRVEMLSAGWKAFLDAPFLGHGWHSQLQAAMPYLSQAAQEGYAVERWSYIHNDALSLAVAAGVPGFLAYISFMAMPLLAAYGRRDARDWNLRIYLALTFTTGLLVSGFMDVLLMVEMSKVLIIVVSASLLFIDADVDPSSAGKE